MTDARDKLTQWLNSIRGVRAGDKADGLIYSCAEDFVLQHGSWYEPVPYSISWRGLPKHCFANSIWLAAMRNWKYIEGFALAPVSATGVWATHHGWNVDEYGQLVDSTWLNTGVAYLGVEFSVERADDASWVGDASVLEDWRRGFPLFRKHWTGETFDTPTSERIQLIRAGKGDELINMLEREMANGT